MSVGKLLSQLRSLDVKIWLEGEKLRLKAPTGTLTPELKKELEAHKEGLIAFLRSATGTTGVDFATKTDSPSAILSPSQLRWWAVQQFLPNSPSFQSSIVLRLRGGLDSSQLRESLNRLVAHHRALRSWVQNVAGSPQCTMTENIAPSFSILSLQAEGARSESEALKLLQEERRKSPQAEHTPSFQAILVSVETDYHLLGLSASRILIDQLSLYKIAESLLEQHIQLNRGGTIAITPEISPFELNSKRRELSQDNEYRNLLVQTAKRIAAFPHDIALQHDNPRPEILDPQTGRFKLSFSEEFEESLEIFCKEEGTDRFSPLLAAFTAFLHHHSGQRHMLVGILSDLRGNEGRDAIGHFENIEVYHASFEDNTSFRDLTRDLERQRIQKSKQPTLAFEDLIDELQVDFDPSKHPLVQIGFSCATFPPPRFNFPQLQVETLDLPTHTCFDLGLQIAATGELEGWLSFSPLLFEHGSVERFGKHLHVLLETLVQQPDRAITEMEVVTVEERHQLIEDWRCSPRSYGEPILASQLFEAGAIKYPQNVALACHHETIRFEELHARSNQIAHYLIEAGIGRGSRVPVSLSPSIEAVSAILAVLKAGAIYVPIDPTFPKGRIAAILDGLGAAILVTSPKFASKFRDSGLRILELTLDSNWFLEQPTYTPETGAQVDDPAFLMFGSGSDGIIRGRIGTHRRLYNRVHWLREHIPLEPAQTVLSAASADWCTLWDLIWPLNSGAALQIIKPRAAYSPSALAELIEQASINCALLHAPLLEAFVQKIDPEKIGTLKWLAACSAPLTQAQQQSVSLRFPELKLFNFFGPKERTEQFVFWSGAELGYRCKPIANLHLLLLDAKRRPVPIGVPGEVYLGSEGGGWGTFGVDNSHSPLFIDDPFGQGRFFRSGDIARYYPDGTLEFMPNSDWASNYPTPRISTLETEQLISRFPGVLSALALPYELYPGEKKLVAYYTAKEEHAVEPEVLRAELKRFLPPIACPEALVQVSAFPKTPSGTIDRRALPVPKEFQVEQMVFPSSYSETERILLELWQTVLKSNSIGIHDDFFENGGTLLQLIQVHAKLPEALRRDISLLDLLRCRTIHALDSHLERLHELSIQWLGKEDSQARVRQHLEKSPKGGYQIAIVGMSGRFPGANTPDQLWQNIRNGISSITFFTKEQLVAEGVDPELVEDPDYVRAQAVLDNVKGFDAGFFELTPREVQITDPQQRLFLECAWEALEHAGHAPGNLADRQVGIYAGIGPNKYLTDHLLPNQQLLDTVGFLPITIGNDNYNMTARASFKLNLNGPSMVVSTACSSSLVAIHLACQALKAGDCQVAIAGGVFLGLLNRVGYMYEEGMLYAPDGVCRSFDAKAMGTVPGQGLALVVLKPLKAALADGNQIHAIIRGSAVNNDGSLKDGYTSYGVEGQSRCIVAAMNAAKVGPEQIGYVETSSSGSKLGDSIEVKGLTKAYRQFTDKKQFVPIGALKPNIGSLDTAAGVSALLKAVFALKHRELPPTLNFSVPNPAIDFESSPVFVNDRLREWKTDQVRIAGVSGFGLGGGNAHIILQEGLEARNSAKSRPWELVVISAKTATALETLTEKLTTYIKDNAELHLGDLCFTLQAGRQHFKHRRVLVTQSLEKAVQEVQRRNPVHVLTRVADRSNRPIAFMFPGQGAQYTNMGRQLYQGEPSYREEVNRCWEIIKENAPTLYENLNERDRGGRSEKLHQTYVTQPATFIVEYALAKTLMKWGIRPQAMIGNSLGEYVAACLSGVMSLTDALNLVVTRGRLMQKLPPGRQLAARLSEQELQPYLNAELSLAGVAGPKQTMISGTKDAINALKNRLEREGIECYRLFTSHAFHSFMMEPIMPEFMDHVRNIQLHPPQIPFISTITGTWITPEQATDPKYWAMQFRQPVRFSQGLELLLQEPDRILLEVGPEKTLSQIANAHPLKTIQHAVLSTMRQPQERDSDLQVLLTAVGRLWLLGTDLDWEAFHTGFRQRLPLPGYPFERQTHWIYPTKRKPVLELDQDEISVNEQADANSRPNVSTRMVQPRDEMERTIVQVWREFLGLPEIGIHDDFFELGGSSLIAIRLLQDLGKKFKVPLATHELLQRRTVATLAERIREKSAQPAGSTGEASCLVEIQRGSQNRLPVFMVHPIGGDVYFFKDLALNLGPQQPIYGFQAPSLTGEVKPYNDLEKQAADYIKDLLKFRPNPPYVLGGASYGGVVAYEMAQQLTAMGKEVPLIIVIDSPAPGAMPVRQKDSASILSYLLGDKLTLSVESMRELSVEEQMAYIQEELRLNDQTNALPVNLCRPLFDTWLSHQDAMFDYQPKTYNGRVLFFRHTDMLTTFPPNVHLPWLELVKGGIEIHQIPGNHITMNFNPNAKILAKHVRWALNAVSSDSK